MIAGGVAIAIGVAYLLGRRHGRKRVERQFLSLLDKNVDPSVIGPRPRIPK